MTAVKGKFNLSEGDYVQGLIESDFYKVKDKTGKSTYAWQEDVHATVKGKASKSEMEGRREGNKQDVGSSLNYCPVLGSYEKRAVLYREPEKGP